MKTSTRRGFTLVELLVVVAIIGLLAAILMPSLSRVQHLARAAKCSSNLHQLGVAWSLHRTKAKAARQRCLSAPLWTGELIGLVSRDPAVLLCPSDGLPSRSGLENSAIRVSRGSGDFLYDMDLAANEFTRYLTTDQYDQWSQGGYQGSAPGSNDGGGGDSYYLAFEDIRPTGGDWDYNDIVMRVDIGADGTTSISVAYSSAGYSFDLVSGGSMLQQGLKTFNGTITLPSLPTSYGMNVAAQALGDSGKGGSILLLDYCRSVANCAGPDATDNWADWNIGGGHLRFARHNGLANVVYTDGHVQRQHPFDIDPDAPNIARRLWLP